MSDRKSLSLFLVVMAAVCFGWAVRAPAAPGGAEILVAKPQLKGMVFGGAIVLVKPLENGGHVGFILNKPTIVKLEELFPEQEASKKVADPLHFGGPMDINMMFALVERQDGTRDDSMQITPTLYLAVKAEAVDHIIETESEHARFFLGMVGWAPGELEEEIKRGLWYEDEPDAKLVFSKKTDGMWEELLLRSQRRANAL